MSDLWVVIPAAGKSQRFVDAGYDTPKPLLRIQSKAGAILPMMMHVRLSLPAHINPAHILVGLPTELVLEESTNFIPIRRTSGQADTVYQMLYDLPQDDSVLVLDCDMILKAYDLLNIITALASFDVVIAVTETFDPNASRVDSVPFPTRFVEKEPISQWGIVGARAFKNIGELHTALGRTIIRSKTINKEPYLSVAINHYPGKKYAYIVNEYQDWGTPERLKESGAKIL